MQWNDWCMISLSLSIEVAHICMSIIEQERCKGKSLRRKSVGEHQNHRHSLWTLTTTVLVVDFLWRLVSSKMPSSNLHKKQNHYSHSLVACVYCTMPNAVKNLTVVLSIAPVMHWVLGTLSLLYVRLVPAAQHASRVSCLHTTYPSRQQRILGRPPY